jgi:hypothetical protein
VNDQHARYVRLRHTAAGALGALAVVGAIAGATALAANSHAKPHRHAAVANDPTKTPAPGTNPTKTPAPGKHRTPQPPQAYDPNNPFLIAIRQLVNDGTITAAQAQVVDDQILQGYIDPSTLSGLTQSQLQAVEQALSNTKRAMGPTVSPAGGKNPTPQQDAKHRHS